MVLKKKIKILLYVITFSWIILLLIAFDAFYLSHWCVIQPRDQEAICKAAHSAAQAFERHNITYFLCKGSLLGAVLIGNIRDQDNDVDLCVFVDRKDAKKQFQRIEKPLQEITQNQHNFYYTSHIYEESPVLFRLPISPLKAWWSHIWVDIYRYTTSSLVNGENKHPSDLILPQKGPLSTSWTYQYHDIFPLKRIEYCNGRIFWGPQFPEKVLEKMYGEDYPIEVIWGFRGQRCSLLYW